MIGLAYCPRGHEDHVFKTNKVYKIYSRNCMECTNYLNNEGVNYTSIAKLLDTGVYENEAITLRLIKLPEFITLLC